jgi:hypothetical protein
MSGVRDRIGSRMVAKLARPDRWPAPVHRHASHQRDLKVPAQDGATLLTDMWWPTDTPDAPVLLVRSPYGRRGLVGWQFGRLLSHQGFRVVVQSCRGTDGSGGGFERPFAAEASDGQAVVEWMRHQPWFAGRFATVGSSYLGYTQLALATDPPPELAAMVVQFAPLDLRSVVYPDGVLAVATALGWSQGVVRDPTFNVRNGIHMARHGKADAAKVDAASRKAPLTTSYQDATGRRVPFFEEWLAHPPTDDEWWSRYDVRGALDRINVPVLVQGGWYDVFVRDTISAYERLRDRGVDVDLTIGAWVHGSVVAAWSELLADTVSWLRSTLDVPAAVEVRGSGVRAQLQPTGEWCDAAAWPPGPTHERQWWLGPETLSVAPAGVADEVAFRFDPDDPTPHLGGNYIGDGAGAVDDLPLEHRADTAVFTTPPFDAAFTIAGEPVAELEIDADSGHFDVFARLCLVAEDSSSTNLSDAIAPVARDEACGRVTIRLTPTFATVQQGQRLRLVLAGGAHPRWLRHSGTVVAAATATELRAVTQRVTVGEADSSWFVLPVLEQE